MKLVILDRDGVINGDHPGCVETLDQFKLISGTAEAIRLFNKNGYKVAIATNQALVGRGQISQGQLDEIHSYMLDRLTELGAHIDHVFFCTEPEPHYRRKPEPGMLFEALEMFQANPLETPFVGDALRDLEAAEKARCLPILVRTGKGKKTIAAGLPETLKGTPIFDNLLAFAKHWIQPE